MTAALMPSKRQQRKAEIRQRIFDNCIALLGQKSFQDISIQDICIASGVARQTFYNHFQSKDELLDQISQAMFFDGSINALQEAMQHFDTAAERLTYSFEKLFEPIMTFDGDSADIIVQLIQNMTAGIRQNGKQMARFHAAAQHYFSACAINEDSKNGWDSDFVADLVVNSSVGIVLSWVDDQGYPAKQRIAQLHAHIRAIVLSDD